MRKEGERDEERRKGKKYVMKKWRRERERKDGRIMEEGKIEGGVVTNE